MADTPAASNVAMPASSSVAALIRGGPVPPAPLPEPKVEVEQGLEPELLEHDGVARLGRSMAGDQPRARRPGARRRCDERRGAGDEPVEHDRDAGRGRREMTPTSAAISRPPTAASDADRVAGPGRCRRERRVDDGDLARTASRRGRSRGRSPRPAAGR